MLNKDMMMVTEPQEMTPRERIEYLNSIKNDALRKSLTSLTIGDTIGFNKYIHRSRAAIAMIEMLEQAQRN